MCLYLQLRLDNKKLREEIVRIRNAKWESHNVKSGPSSGLEFVASPDDDTINKLTAQLGLVENQRREVRRCVLQFLIHVLIF